MYPVESIVCEVNAIQDFDPQYSKYIEQTDKDPLDGLGGCSEEKFYRLDKVIFADPINSVNDFRNECILENKFTFFDKVTVEKRVGRRNKYHIEMEDFTKPICPETNCNKLFSSVKLLKAHIRKVHCAEQRFVCEMCGSGFAAKYLLARHMAVHEKRKARCPVCAKMLSERTKLLKAHIRKVHCAEQRFVCDMCGSGFAAKYLLARHMAVHEKRRVRCPVCAKMLSERTNLSDHMRFVHRQGTLKCNKCDLRFDRRIQFVRHKSSHKG